MVKDILGYLILLAGLGYAIAILRITKDRKDDFNKTKGDLKVLGFWEVVLFFFVSLGLPDYVLHTILGKRMRIVTDEELPGTVVVCSIVPGSILGFLLLKSGDTIGLKTLLLCGIATALGSFLGSHMIGKMDGALIRRIMQIALILSLIFIIIRMIISSGASGTETELTGIKLAVVTALCFFIGIINMFGIPMKPTRTALFLISGLSPIAALTMVLVAGSLAPLSGGYEIIKSGKYQMKMAFSSVVFGTVGAVIGGLLAVSIPAIVLNIVLIAVMILAIVIMFRN